MEQHKNITLYIFMSNIIEELKQMGKIRSSETYTATLKSFMNYMQNKQIMIKDISSETMVKYEAYLQYKGLKKNSTSFYMRILRAVYNRAVEKEIIADRRPFKHVYTGIDRTVKRAISLNEIKQIKDLDLKEQPSLEFARDMFIFSFYTRGMSFIDMAYLKKKDISNGILSYRRHKTGQQLHIHWERCMQDIIEKHNDHTSKYLLPIIKPSKGNERTQYQNAMFLTNRKLKIIGMMAKVQIPLTTYTARHSWANIAKIKNVPISIISEGMGHNSEKTTQIYLAAIDAAEVDKANRMIIKLLQK